MKAGVASLQENWREAPEPLPLAGMLATIAAGPARATPQMFVFRDALEREGSAATFGAVVGALARVPLAAPFYVIVGGPAGEGVVMARNLTASEGTTTLSGGGGLPFLVQTNYDHWLPDPPTDPRRTHAEAMLSQITHAESAASGQASAPAAPPPSLTSIDLFAVASAYPVHNPHTAYTAILEPATGALVAYVRDALCPAAGSPLAHADARYCL